MEGGIAGCTSSLVDFFCIVYHISMSAVLSAKTVLEQSPLAGDGFFDNVTADGFFSHLLDIFEKLSSANTVHDIDEIFLLASTIPSTLVENLDTKVLMWLERNLKEKGFYLASNFLRGLWSRERCAPDCDTFKRYVRCCESSDAMLSDDNVILLWNLATKEGVVRKEARKILENSVARISNTPLKKRIEEMLAG